MNKISLVFLSVLFSLSSLAMEQFPSITEAVKAGDLNAVKKWIALGANVNQQDEDGATALMHAIYVDQKLVECLIQNGADIHLQDDLGRTALIDAARSRAQAALIRYLLGVGAQVDQQDNLCRTALIYAVIFNDLGKIECLIQAGASVNHADYRGETPLYMATGHELHGNLHNRDTIEKLIEILLRAGANPYILTRNRDTPFRHAALKVDRQIRCRPFIKLFMRTPNKDQVKRIKCLFCCVKYMPGLYALRNRMNSLLKPFLQYIIEQENQMNPAESFAWKSITALEFPENVLEDQMGRKKTTDHVRAELYLEVLKNCPDGTVVEIRDPKTNEIVSKFSR